MRSGCTFLETVLNGQRVLVHVVLIDSASVHQGSGPMIDPNHLIPVSINMRQKRG